MFERGQKVICVDDQGHYGWWPLEPNAMLGLIKGRIYTVRAVGIYRKTPCIWLEEIRRSITLDFGECGYSPCRFKLFKHSTEAGMETLKKAADAAMIGYLNCAPAKESSDGHPDILKQWTETS